MTYPVILNGDHADFEREHANALPQDRPDWPLPSFDARDWATAFCKHNPRLMKDRDEWRDKALKSSPAEPRPANCRNRRRDEGKPYPKSGCHACGTGGMTGCPHERGALPADADRLRLADIKTDQLETVDSILTTLDRYTDSIQGKNDLKCGILMANYAMLEAAKIIRLLVSLRAGGWREDTPRYRHKKRGSEYTLIGVGKMQAEHWRDPDVDADYDSQRVDMREVAIYRADKDGSLWVRPREEFEDGRFERLPSAPKNTDKER